MIRWRILPLFFLVGCRAFVASDAQTAAQSATASIAKTVDSPEEKKELDDAARSMFDAIRDEATSDDTKAKFQAILESLSSASSEKLITLEKTFLAELLSPANHDKIVSLIHDSVRASVDELLSEKTSAAMLAIEKRFFDDLTAAFVKAEGTTPVTAAQVTTAAIAPVNAEIEKLTVWLDRIGIGFGALTVLLVVLWRELRARGKTIDAHAKRIAEMEQSE